MNRFLLHVKCLIIIMPLLACGKVTSQEIGVINDPDGYTTIRKGEGVNHPEVGRIEEAHQFIFYSNDRSDWWRVETMPYYGSPLKGYVHKTRIQPYYMESPNCHCPSDFWSEGLRTVFIANLEKSTVSVCGYLLQRTGQNSIKVSEFTISNCETNEIIHFYSAVVTCELISREKSLEIIELEILPLGAGFEWIEVPYKMTILSDISGIPTFVDDKFILDLSKISDSDINSFLAELPNYKGIGYFEEIETFIGKLLICSLKGNEQCKTIFKDIENYVRFELDGVYAEFYSDCSDILEYSKSQ